MTQKEQFKLTADVFSKTLASQIEPVKFEDIPTKISEVLSSALKTNVTVRGNGLTDDIKAKI